MNKDNLAITAKKLHLKEKHYKLLLAIITKYPFTINVYGSRIKGNHSEFSDLDLCIMDPEVDIFQKLSLEEELEGSDLPFKVDIICWHEISEKFKNAIASSLTPVI